MRNHLLLLCFVLVAASGCAAFNRNNTPALNWVEHNLVAKKQPYKSLSYAYAVPAGMVAVAGDSLIYRPYIVIDDAIGDTGEVWRHFDWDNQYVSSCATIVPRAVVTPIVFAGSFVLRTVFDVPEREPSVPAAPKQEPKQQTPDPGPPPPSYYLEQARTLLAEGKIEAARQAVRNSNLGRHYRRYLTGELTIDELEEFAILLRPSLAPLRRDISDDQFRREVLVPLEKSSPRIQYLILNTMQTYQPVLQVYRHESILLPVLEKLLQCENRIVAYETLVLIARHQSDPDFRRMLKETADGDDPVLSLAAKTMLKQ